MITKQTVRLTNHIVNLVPELAVQPRNYDLGWLIPDWYLVREHDGRIPTWPLRSGCRDGNKYTHLSRVEWNEVRTERRIYIKGSDPKVLMPGLPAAVQFLGSGRVPLTGVSTDILWWDVFNANAPSGMTWATRLRRYAGLKADGVCFTDFTGGHEYNPILTTSNVIYLLGDKKDMGGEMHLSFRTLKVGSLGYMQGQLTEWPLLKMNATISLRTYDGMGVDPFPQLDGRDVPFLPFGKTSEIGWIPASRVREMSRSEPIPDSYFPSR